MWTAMRARRLTVLGLALVAVCAVERSSSQALRSDNAEQCGDSRTAPEALSSSCGPGGRGFESRHPPQLTRIQGPTGQRWDSGASESRPSRPPRKRLPLAGPTAGTLTMSLPDASGRASAEFSPGPQVLYLGADQTVTDYLVAVPLQATLCEVRSFVGWDRGSIGEAGLDVNARGARLYERSDHREAPTTYDAWRARPVRFDLVAGDELHVQFRASQTGPNSHDAGRSTRVEVALRLTLSLTGVCPCE